MERQFMENLYDSHDRSHFIPDDEIARIVDRRPTAFTKQTTRILVKLGTLLITWGSHLKQQENLLPSNTEGKPTAC